MPSVHTTTNKELAKQFVQIAQLLELIGADKFRIIAHDRAARIIEDQPARLLDIAGEEDAKKKLEAQCLRDYKVNLDMRKSLADMQKDCDKAKVDFDKEIAAAAVKAKAKAEAAK